MKRLTIELDPDLERDLREYVARRNISSKAEAVRQALHQALGKQAGDGDDFRQWLRMGLKAPLNGERRFFSEDDLWSKTA